MDLTNALGNPRTISRTLRKPSTRFINVIRIARLPRTYPSEPRIGAAASGQPLGLLSVPFGHHEKVAELLGVGFGARAFWEREVLSRP